MEAIGAASAILAIATAGVQCSVKLVTFAGQVKTAPEQITMVAENVSLSASILQQLGELATENIENEHPTLDGPNVKSVPDTKTTIYGENIQRTTAIVAYSREDQEFLVRAIVAAQKAQLGSPGKEQPEASNVESVKEPPLEKEQPPRFSQRSLPKRIQIQSLYKADMEAQGFRRPHELGYTKEEEEEEEEAILNRKLAVVGGGGEKKEEKDEWKETREKYQFEQAEGEDDDAMSESEGAEGIIDALPSRYTI
ncbi:hypothetical protein N7537_010683 [Penicillium hordei]|uniref:Uncharacterized protein n=1 Tax=Penicillium hordei TaxID=40994 RepID=A0AAD6DV32_9EURO|nr:uncharacterized protein N7537_010683 [Penicillium hordei]KAJ5593779.1 hypothetical protein N7537_010683 [Penicillium hordei]